MKTKICKKCGTTDFYACGKCKQCIKTYQSSNHENIKNYQKKYRFDNQTKTKEQQYKYRINNAEKVKKRKDDYYINNKENILKRMANYYEENTEKLKSKSKKYQTENLEKLRIYAHNRRIRQFSTGKLSSNLAEKLFKLQRGKCACCGKPLGDNYHLDHIMPLALGGANEDWNIQLLTQRCNNQKHAKHPVDFMRSRGFLI